MIFSNFVGGEGGKREGVSEKGGTRGKREREGEGQ